ncbi:uncharacterized protein BT62DRAFT_934660 [Guyanagaster necrorhizus]|uniref:Uncharacterized protein n=1 Tax=Guyanagaster necrorhizus TaxID=856835 RepID=A0A9P8APU4_9AGAR|nr:uncharacterized protein BT62DRAFT_934660 [Guyanagaster necrorhizus MCA 3950]KAG7443703.1 hypothetical protein BT62DRAFT_934660 [Guyanagaster necrorhizus MCA 3950]
MPPFELEPTERELVTGATEITCGVGGVENNDINMLAAQSRTVEATAETQKGSAFNLMEGVENIFRWILKPFLFIRNRCSSATFIKSNKEEDDADQKPRGPIEGPVSGGPVRGPKPKPKPKPKPYPSVSRG